MIKIKIDLKRDSYFIFLKNNIFDYVAKFHQKNYPDCRAIIITDNNVKKYYLTKFTNKFSDNAINFDYYCILAGEKSKSFKTLESLATNSSIPVPIAP